MEKRYVIYKFKFKYIYIYNVHRYIYNQICRIEEVIHNKIRQPVLKEKMKKKKWNICVRNREKKNGKENIRQIEYSSHREIYIVCIYIYRIPCNKVFQVFSKYQLNSFEFIKTRFDVALKHKDTSIIKTKLYRRGYAKRKREKEG